MKDQQHSCGYPEVTGFFDPRTFSVQYIVSDPATRRSAIIDPVLDYDHKSGATATHNADRLIANVRERGLQVDWILDTHAHADHLSAAAYLGDALGAPTGICAQITEVQALWAEYYNLPSLAKDGSQWDHLFADDERIKLGELELRSRASPGHTPASMTYCVGDAAFIHDTLFMPDFGTARADFPGGDAGALWRSIQAILALPDDTRLFTGHDYMPGGRQPCWESSVVEQRRTNVHLADCADEASYRRFRQARDAELPMPELILDALQVNIRGGRLPEPEENGRRYLRIPLDTLAGACW